MDNEKLFAALNAAHDIAFTGIELVRDWVGTVYKVLAGDGQNYILKLFRAENVDSARISCEVMEYLRAKDIEVPGIFRTREGKMYFEFEGCLAVLYEFIDGEDVESEGQLSELGYLAGRMCAVMADYPGRLPVHGREFFLDRYIEIMHRLGYTDVGRFEAIADRIWSVVERLPLGFCHGDLHCGNMFLRDGRVVMYDFDACALRSAAYDAATMCDATDYFSLKMENFTDGIDKTRENLREYLSGFRRAFDMSDEAEAAVPAFIAVRHFDIQATIITALGDDCVKPGFFDRQLQWLECWLNQFM